MEQLWGQAVCTIKMQGKKMRELNGRKQWRKEKEEKEKEKGGLGKGEGGGVCVKCKKRLYSMESSLFHGVNGKEVGSVTEVIPGGRRYYFSLIGEIMGRLTTLEL